ncbi:MAG: hypothetical protein M5R36_11945 [Deltaproteobacteria bacterium]|nr:hypothetical protein [Deltaproteobacteria bacterium]
MMVEYDDEEGEETSPVGCAYAELDVGGEIHYNAPTETQPFWPDPGRDTEEPDIAGTGTYPLLVYGMFGESSLVAYNVDPGEVTLTIYVNEEELELTIPDVCADCYVTTYAWFDAAEYGANPTHENCTY